MSFFQHLAILFLAIISTQLTRFLPFLLFPAGKPTPARVRYLGTVLPSAVFGLLVIYCLKDVSFTTGTHGLPELLSMGMVILLHLWKRQFLLSMAGGTLFYMVMVQMEAFT